MPDDLDMSPLGPHYTVRKDGTRVWVGGAVEELNHIQEQLRLANMRISAARRVLTQAFHAKTVETAIAALDFVPSGRR
jgi:hypothetical protein